MFQTLEVEGATVLFLTGDLDADMCVHLQERVLSLIRDGCRVLVMELSGVQRIYAAGMSVLLELQRTTQGVGGRLICCGARPFIREILRITSMDRMLQHQMDLDCALDVLAAAS